MRFEERIVQSTPGIKRFSKVKAGTKCQFGEMPLSSDIKGGWNNNHVRFKFERGQVNIQLGMGKGIEYSIIIS